MARGIRNPSSCDDDEMKSPASILAAELLFYKEGGASATKGEDRNRAGTYREEEHDTT